MPFACLVAFAMLAQTDAQALIPALTSPRASERKAAETALKGLGDAARPVLNQARESRDLELRMRAASLLDELDGERLSRASRVKLDFPEAPLGEVIREISERTGVTLVLQPDNAPIWRNRKVRLIEPGPVSLWEALEKLGRVGGVKVASMGDVGNGQHMMVFNGGVRRRASTGVELAIRPDDGSGTPPTSLSGAFRFTLAALRLDRTKDFLRPLTTPGAPSASARFTVQFAVLPEPRVTVAKVGEVQLLEAVDDRGQSLVAPQSVPTIGPGMLPNPQGNPFPGAATVSLRYPEEPGQTITRLKGTVRVSLIGRRDDPIVVPIDPTRTTTGRSEDASLTIFSVKPGPNGRGSNVDLAILSPEAGPAYNPYAPFDPRAALQPPPSARGHLVLADAKGRVVGTFDLAQFGNGMAARTTLYVEPVERAAPPVEARFYRSTWATIDVPFEFRDVPMP